MSRWAIRRGDSERVVEAIDQHAAWNTLRSEPTESFGLVVTALEEGLDEDERYGIHTSALMFTWGRDEEAILLIEAAIEIGLPDTTLIDMAYALAHGRPVRGGMN